MIDYAKLAADMKAKLDAQKRASDALGEFERTSRVFFKSVETSLTKEIEIANEELKKLEDIPTFVGPFRAFKDEEMMELNLGLRKPCAKLTLEMNIAGGCESRIRVEFLDAKGSLIGHAMYGIEGKGTKLRIFKSVDDGLPELTIDAPAVTIAQHVVAEVISQ